MLCRNSLIQQQPGIIFILYLHKGRLNGVLQAFFLSGISHLKLQDYGILSRLFWLQHNIVSSKATFPVGGYRITISQIHHKPKHKAMIKTFRLRVAARLISRIKLTEGGKRHPVHIFIHGIQIVLQQCFYEFIIIGT